MERSAWVALIGVLAVVAALAGIAAGQADDRRAWLGYVEGRSLQVFHAGGEFFTDGSRSAVFQRSVDGRLHYVPVASVRSRPGVKIEALAFDTATRTLIVTTSRGVEHYALDSRGAVRSVQLPDARLRPSA